MKGGKLHNRDRREDRLEREEKLSAPAETLPGKTIRDRDSKAGRIREPSDFARSKRQMNSGKRARRAKKEEQASARPVSFRLKTESARSVHVAGTFNGWDPLGTPLVRDPLGEWHIEIPLEPGEYEYRFLVDGVWQEDPCAFHSVPNPFGSCNSIIMVA
jgi:hypothetical protein